MKLKLLILCSLILVISTSVYAQTTTSKIAGTITEKTGEALFGANIIALHTPTGTISGTTAQNNGRYTLSNLRIGGPYTITISYVGFETQKISKVFLTLGKTTNIDAVLSDDTNTLDEIVISSGKNTVFNNGRTGAQTSIRSKDLRTLPTISRSASDFTRLDPAASGGSFGGRNDQYNNFTLDGSIFNNPFGLDAATPGGQTGSQPVSLDAIEQISVSTAPYDVTLSGFTGASVNAVTKSGTNAVSGTVYGFFRNQDFTGGKIKGENIFVPQLRQSQSGVSVGAPLIKDKLFIFVNFEEDKRTDYPGKEIAYLVQNRWDKNFVNDIAIIVGDEWVAGNLSYHLQSRPRWFNNLTPKLKNLELNGGVIYVGNAKILKSVCPGEFGTIKKQGICMIGTR